jgi:hypothetical protein
MHLFLAQNSERVKNSTNSLSKLLQHPRLSTGVKKEYIPHTASSFRKQTTPFSITLSTPTCDLINIYTLCLPQGRGVQDVVILLIGATQPPFSLLHHRTIILQLTTTRNVTTLPPRTRLTGTFVSSVPCGFNWLRGGGEFHFNPSMPASMHCTDL